LASAAIQRQHELCGQALATGVGGDERLEFSDDRGVLTELQAGIHPGLERGQAQLLKAPDLGLCELLVDDLAQRRSAPHPQGLTQRSLCPSYVAGLKRAAPVVHARLKHLRVELARFHREQVAASDSVQHRFPADPGDLECLT
jgi:hypothetical protein